MEVNGYQQLLGQNIFLCFQLKKEVHTCLEQIQGE